MDKPPVDYAKISDAFAGLRQSVNFTALNSREFAEADLDQLAAEGIFPEENFLLSFRTGAEAAVLPLFGGDRNAFDEAQITHVGLAGEAFERAIERHHFDAL